MNRDTWRSLFGRGRRCVPVARVLASRSRGSLSLLDRQNCLTVSQEHGARAAPHQALWKLPSRAGVAMVDLSGHGCRDSRTARHLQLNERWQPLRGWKPQLGPRCLAPNRAARGPVGGKLVETETVHPLPTIPGAAIVAAMPSTQSTAGLQRGHVTWQIGERARCRT